MKKALTIQEHAVLGRKIKRMLDEVAQLEIGGRYPKKSPQYQAWWKTHKALCQLQNTMDGAACAQFRANQVEGFYITELYYGDRTK